MQDFIEGGKSMAILFWPFMVASIVFSFIAIARKQPSFLVVSFFLIIPFSFYIGAMPLFKWWGFLLPFFFLGASLALRKNVIWLSILLVIPVLLMVGWVGYLVITQG